MSEMSAREKLLKKFGNTKIGGKGTQKRVVKPHVVKKNKEDKKLKGLVKKFSCQPIPEKVEVNIFNDNNEVLHFNSTEVFTSMPNRILIIFGEPEIKNLKESVSEFKMHLSNEQLEKLKDSLETKEDENVPNLVDFNK